MDFWIVIGAGRYALQRCRRRCGRFLYFFVPHRGRDDSLSSSWLFKFLSCFPLFSSDLFFELHRISRPSITLDFPLGLSSTILGQRRPARLEGFHARPYIQVHRSFGHLDSRRHRPTVIRSHTSLVSQASDAQTFGRSTSILATCTDGPCHGLEELRALCHDKWQSRSCPSLLLRHETDSLLPCLVPLLASVHFPALEGRHQNRLPCRFSISERKH